MTWTEFTQKAMFVPFIEHGRDYDGWDCYGLVICGYRDVLGVELPHNHSDYDTTLDYKRIARGIERDKAELWSKCEMKMGAVALIKRRSRNIHIGIVMPAKTILHCDTGVNTINQTLNFLRIEGFYEFIG